MGVMVLGGFTHSAETFPILGVFLKPITEEFGWTRSQFTGAMTIGTILGSVIAVGIGPMLDRYGGRWLMTIGFIVLGLSFLLMGGMSTIWHFYVLQIAGRMFHMGIISVGISGLGSRFGGTVWPLITQALVTSVGWRFASLAVGGSALLFGALPAAIFLRRRPEDIGLRPDGAPQAENGIDGKFLKGAPVRDDVSLTVRQVIRTRAFYLITASFSMLFLASSATNLHLIPHLTDQKISTQVAVIVVSMWGVGAFFGRIHCGPAIGSYQCSMASIWSGPYYGSRLCRTNFDFIRGFRTGMGISLWIFPRMERPIAAGATSRLLRP